VNSSILAKLQAAELLELQRQKQQGLGQPIIAESVGDGLRVIAVGNTLYRTKAKTFHEFLWEYVKTIFGGSWGNAELARPPDQRHPLLNWYQKTAEYINSHIREPGKIHNIASVGIVSGYFQLAYSLYLIAHNEALERRLIERLKHPDQFLPAYYETLVFGALIRAGFQLAFEDETDSSRTHCEVTATFPNTGKKFSVEAKMRQATTASTDIGRQLAKALRKEAAHARIVFAEVNLPELPNEHQRVDSMQKILTDIRVRESDATLPPAYVVITNHPFLYFPDKPVQSWALAEGFRLPDFGWRAAFPALREALNARDKHREMFALRKSWEENQEIPSTFDGEIPEFASDSGPPRLLIGHLYNIPDGNGGETVGILRHAEILTTEKLCYGFYDTAEKQNLLVTCPVTDDEIAAYERYPETFFGVPKRSGQIRDPLDFYDWTYACYKESSKENLLKLLADAPDTDSLTNLARDELLQTYCERITTSFFAGISKPPDG
jgi:hypothetical protein